MTSTIRTNEVAPGLMNIAEDADLWFVVLLVTLIGVAAVGSAAVSHAGFDGDLMSTVGLHLRNIFVGVVVAFAIYSVDLERMQQYSKPIFLFALCLLALVFVPGLGSEVNGSKRWLNLGLMNFQPSEFVKLAAILYCADYVVRMQSELMGTWRGVLRPLVLFAVMAGLLVFEPDLGATVVIMATVMAILFLGGAQLPTFVAVVTTGGAVLALAIALARYRRERFMSFWDPWDDPFGSDYQLLNSLIAIGRGAVDGTGWSDGYQKLGFLPEAHTDFIFAVIAEELGFIGVLVVVITYSALIYTLWQRGRRADEANLGYGAMVAYGIAFWFSIQAFVNVGVNLGMLPPKGITLPLVSFGGSSLMMCFAAIGVMMRISVETREAEIKAGNNR